MPVGPVNGHQNSMPDARGDIARREPAKRGADPVNDELEVGFSSDFETRWHRYELAGRVVLGAVVLAGLAGLLGSGPLSHHRMRLPTGSLAAVDFEPIARFGTPTQITFHIRPEAGVPAQEGHSLDLRLSSIFVEPFGLQGIHPAGREERAAGGDLVVTVLTANGASDPLVRVTGKPSQIGPITLTASVGDEPPVQFTQYVLP
jgi:hypothetical protein